MPKLGLPICLKSDLTQYHRVTKYLTIEDEHKVVTGSLNGDLVIWRVYHQHHSQASSNAAATQPSASSTSPQTLIQPIRFLTPCLSQTVGHVTCLELVRNPILSEMEGNSNSILSIHKDNRVRIWDIEDGRCVNISSHAPFECPAATICRPLTFNNNRFFAVAGKGRTIEVLDVWKLRSIFTFKIDGQTVCDIKVVHEKKQMYAVDNKNILYCFDISDYSNDDASVYSSFMNNQKELNKRVKDAKLRLVKKVRLTSSKQQLIEIHIQQNLSIIALVYPTKIIFQKADELYSILSEPVPSTTQQSQTNQGQPQASMTPAAAATPAPSSLMSSSQQQQLMQLIQRSQDIMSSNSNQSGGFAHPPNLHFSQQMNGSSSTVPSAAAPAPVVLTKLKKKITFRLPSDQAENPELLINSIQIFEDNDVPHALIYFKNGGCQVLSLSDISILLKFNEACIANDFTFDFASFSYSKLENMFKGTLTMQLVEILAGKGITSKDYIDFGSNRYDVLCYEPKHRYLLEFHAEKSTLHAHPLPEHLSKIHQHIAQIKYCKQAGEQLESESDKEHTINYLDLKVIFTTESLQGSMYKKIDFNRLRLPAPAATQSWSLVSLENRLCDNERIFNSTFYVKYGTYFEDRFGNERISITSMDFVDQNNPYYFFGTESGKVIGIPLHFSDDKETFDILYYELDTYARKPITFLEFTRGYLVVSSESSATAVLALADSIQLLLKPNSNSGSAAAATAAASQAGTVQSQSAATAGGTSGKDRLNIIDLSPCVKYTEVFAAPVKRVMKLKILQSIKKDPAYEEIVKEHEKYLKHTFCFILSNNSVAVYNTRSHSTEFKLNSNKGSIYGLYFNPVSDYFITLTSEGQVNFWSMGSMRFEKSGKFSQYASLFDLESLIEESFSKVQKGRNDISMFKEINAMSISHVHNILEFNQRFFDDTVNYSDESSTSKAQSNHLVYEQLGELRDTKHTPEQQLTLLWMLQELKPTIYQSQNRENGMSILKLKLNRVKKQTFQNQAFILFVDFKKHNQQIVDRFENSHHPEDHQIFSYVPFLYPWSDQVKKADLSVANLINHKRPVFNYIVGCAGMGQCFSFSLEKGSQYSTSSYLSSIQALSIILHLMNIGNFKDNNLTYNVMLDVANNFTKYKKRVHPRFKSLSLPILSRYCIDDSNEVMSSASNLIINYLVQQDEDNSRYMKLAVQFFSMNMELQKKSEEEATLSICEITWLFIITYTNIFSKHQIGDMKQYIKRIVQVVELKNCLANPNLVAPCMKILTEGISLWKDMIDNYKELMANLIFIYFHYNTSTEQLDQLKDIPKPQLKRAVYLDLFLKQHPNTRKRMKLMTIKTLISLVSVCQNEFLMLVSREIVNVDRHPLYPCSIIDIMRNYIKVQTPNASSKLPVFIEIILKSLDPNNPQFRKICHGPAQKALVAIYQFFPNISYHNPSQKFAVGTSSDQIFIYDLRTAVKWRVLQGHIGSVACLSFDHSGKHIASFSTQDFQLRMWKVGSTGFFSSILNMNGSPTKTVAIPKEQFESVLTQPNCKFSIQWDQQSEKKLQVNIGSLNYRVVLS